MKTIILFSLYGTFFPNLIAEKEIAERHIEEGDDVYIVKCNKILESCFANLHRDSQICQLCQQGVINEFRRVQPPLKIINLLAHPEALSQTLPSFQSLEELRAYSFQGIDIGMGVASSLISLLRDHQFDLRENSLLVERSIRSALNSYFNFRDLIDRLKPNIIYLFNGRFAETRPVLRLCLQRDIKFFAFEQGGTVDQYELFENTLPHNNHYCYQQIEKYWAKASPRERVLAGGGWFEQRRRGISPDGYSFTQNQIREKLPPLFDHSKHNIGIFNSSEDEFAAIDDSFTLSLFPSQYEAIRVITEHFTKDPQTVLYLRVHPNLSKLDNSQMREIRSLQHPNLVIVEPDSPVDTYSLLQMCDKILTFGSTVGIEATYWIKPSIMIGPSMYECLDGVYIPQNREELFGLLSQRDLPAKDQIEALKYGLWVATHGYRYQMWENIEKVRTHFILHQLAKKKYPPLKEVFSAVLSRPVVMRKRLFWKLLFRSLMGQKFYGLLKRYLKKPTLQTLEPPKR